MATASPLTFRKRWAEQWQKKTFKIEIFLSMFFTINVMVQFSRFLEYNEARTLVSRLHDPLFSFIGPTDYTLFTGLLIYCGALLAIVSLARRPENLVLFFKAYGLMILFRIGTLYLTPLAAPLDTIVLKDSLAELAASQAKPLEKDLFFSGHTATMFLFFLCVRGKILKSIFAIATLTIVYVVIAQHIHYSIDVYVAPFVSYTSYAIASMIGMHRKAATN